ncbi:MAG: hypothetical protein ACM3UW_03510 [Bacillota bacterium]
MYRIKSDKRDEGNSKSDRYTVIIPIASKRKPKPAQDIHDAELAKAVETQFNIILPDLPPVNLPTEPTKQ